MTTATKTRTTHTRNFSHPLGREGRGIVATVTTTAGQTSFIVRMSVGPGICTSGSAYILRTDDPDRARRHWARMDEMIREKGFELTGETKTQG